MGFGTSLLTLYDFARAAVPTFGEGVIGRVDRERMDERIQLFCRRVLEHTKMQLEVVGADLVPPDQSYVFMSNHRSHMDIPVLYATVPVKTMRMIAKAELFKIPIMGGALRSGGFVEVDRGNRQKAVQSLRQAEAAIKDGVSIWIAPEGTRSQDGRLGSLKKGGFHLALSTRTPIVPIALAGTEKVLPSHGRSIATGVPVRVTFGAPIQVEGHTVGELSDRVRAFLEKHG